MKNSAIRPLQYFQVGEEVLVCSVHGSGVATVIAAKWEPMPIDIYTNEGVQASWVYWVDPDPTNAPDVPFRSESLRKLHRPSDSSFDSLMKSLSVKPPEKKMDSAIR